MTNPNLGLMLAVQATIYERLESERETSLPHLKLAAVEYTADLLLDYTKKLLDGGELHKQLADVLRDVLTVVRERPESLP